MMRRWTPEKHNVLNEYQIQNVWKFLNNDTP